MLFVLQCMHSNRSEWREEILEISPFTIGFFCIYLFMLRSIQHLYSVLCYGFTLYLALKCASISFELLYPCVQLKQKPNTVCKTHLDRLLFFFCFVIASVLSLERFTTTEKRSPVLITYVVMCMYVVFVDCRIQ